MCQRFRKRQILILYIPNYLMFLKYEISNVFNESPDLYECRAGQFHHATCPLRIMKTVVFTACAGITARGDPPPPTPQTWGRGRMLVHNF